MLTDGQGRDVLTGARASGRKGQASPGPQAVSVLPGGGHGPAATGAEGVGGWPRTLRGPARGRWTPQGQRVYTVNAMHFFKNRTVVCKYT